MKAKQFAVIGLGTFGYNVAVELAKKGIQVLAIDNDSEIVNKISQFVTQSLIADATDEKAMADAGVADCDSVVISIGESIETSILTTLIVKELGVKNIIVKCSSLWHSKVAAKLGADTIVYPEFEMAKKLVDSIVTPNILEQIELSKDYNLVEIVAPQEFWGKSIKDSGIRGNYGVNVIAIRKRVPVISDAGESDIGEELNMVPGPDDEISRNDVLVVIGPEKSLEKLKKRK
ncbi:potassium channel family protein [Endomicrobium proavitum]|uniref:Ktr system potassium uptake protein C n=1 Tax=Endomicrobium proavitum TaxID=1408281 RepID=A0A0G3WG30_9BACT|nr:TrkA family potassium uptake protein [Endomicrobium proavitum]AKL97581.1 Ktr system potassium uptake protein C [Endomicrobium proavitum]